MSTNASISQKWAPANGLTTHAGNPIPQDVVFFSQPPEEIGSIISAYSTASKNKAFRPYTRLILLSVLVGSVIAGFILNYACFGSEGIWGIWLYLLPIGVFSLSEKYSERFLPTIFECTFIGSHGWARESIDVGARIQKTQLRFEQAHELVTDFSHYYERGRNKGPHYNLRWFDADGQELGKIEEVAHSGNRLPPDGHPLHFALAAEKLWTQFITPRAKSELQTNGSLIFPVKAAGLKGNYRIRITRKGVSVTYEDTNMHLMFSEMEPIQIFHHTAGRNGPQDECFMIRKKGLEKHTFGQTTVTIPFSEVANVRLLLDLLQGEIKEGN